MAITMPKVQVIFRQLAASLLSRSERGVAILIVKDDTDDSFDHKIYQNMADAEPDQAKYTADNYMAITDVLSLAPYQTHIIRVGTGETVSDALGILEKNVNTGWITVVGQTGGDDTTLVSWIKTQESKGKSYKAIVHKATTPDNMHIVNFYNDTVTFADGRGQKDGVYYLPTLVGIAAVCNVQRGLTNWLCSNLIDVKEVSDNDAAVGAGKFILFHDEEGAIRVGQGINSLTTTDGKNKTEDMKYIETVEAMDMIRDDITHTFRKEYLGNYRNTRDNQMLLISAINGYFVSLADENILDPDFDNRARIDTQSQRQAWVASGKADAATWDEDKTRATPYKRTVFLAGDIKILGSMTDLTFLVQMF